MSSEYLERDDGIFFRYAKPTSLATRIALFVHGFLGNEDSMPVFARNLPEDLLPVFPRAPYQIEPNGYSWVAGATVSALSTYADFLPAVRTFHQALTQLAEAVSLPLQPARILLVGFSQGAAFNFVLFNEYPDLFCGFAGLAGYYPTPSAAPPRSPDPIDIYLAHGVRDETIPVDAARNAVRWFENQGHRVDYCESNSGHKLPLTCSHQLTDYLRRI